MIWAFDFTKQIFAGILHVRNWFYFLDFSFSMLFLKSYENLTSITTISNIWRTKSRQTNIIFLLPTFPINSLSVKRAQVAMFFVKIYFQFVWLVIISAAAFLLFECSSYHLKNFFLNFKQISLYIRLETNREWNTIRESIKESKKKYEHLEKLLFEMWESKMGPILILVNWQKCFSNIFFLKIGKARLFLFC